MNTNFAEQLQDTVSLLEMIFFFLKSKVLDSTEIKPSTAINKHSCNLETQLLN